MCSGELATKRPSNHNVAMTTHDAIMTRHAQTSTMNRARTNKCIQYHCVQLCRLFNARLPDQDQESAREHPCKDTKITCSAVLRNSVGCSTCACLTKAGSTFPSTSIWCKFPSRQRSDKHSTACRCARDGLAGGGSDKTMRAACVLTCAVNECYKASEVHPNNVP